MRELTEGAGVVVGVVGAREDAEALSEAMPHVRWVWLGKDASALRSGAEVDGLVCCASIAGSGGWCEAKQAALEMPVVIVGGAIARPRGGKSSVGGTRCESCSEVADERERLADGGSASAGHSCEGNLVQVVTDWLEREAEALEARATDRMLARVARAFMRTRWKADGGELQ